ncbi:MAG: nitroreductase [Sphingobium sp.]
MASAPSMTTLAQPRPDLAFEALLAARSSCRGFLPDPLPAATIDRLLALAQRAPSWCNVQPWQLTILSGAATDALRDALVEQALHSRYAQPDIPFPTRYEGVYDARRKDCGKQLYTSMGIAPGDREASEKAGLDNFRFFGAPHVAIVHTPEALGEYGLIDCGGYVTALMLAARSLGVATIAQAALALHAPLLHRRLAIPSDRRILCGISFGLEDPDAPANALRMKRAPTAEVATFLTRLAGEEA